jgi:hypothetical protein
MWLQFAIDEGSVPESITPVQEKSSALSHWHRADQTSFGNRVHLGRYVLVMKMQNGNWLIVEHAAFNVHE